MRKQPLQPRTRLSALISLPAVATVCMLAMMLSAPCSASDAAQPAAEKGARAAATELVAYYFHGNLRCATCRKLETYSEEAILEGFPEEIAEGRLIWRTINTDEPENKRYVKDFQLVTKSLVLVEYQEGQVVRSKNLKLIWQLVSDRDGFLTYVREATAEMLEDA